MLLAVIVVAALLIWAYAYWRKHGNFD